MRAHARLDAQFLAQFPHQRVLGLFPRLLLAAGKLPAPGQVTAFGTAGQQDAATRIGDDGSHDMDRSQRSLHGGSLPGTRG